MGLHPDAGGPKLMRDAERTAAALEAGVASRLTPAEQRTLIGLLKKVYQPRIVCAGSKPRCTAVTPAIVCIAGTAYTRSPPRVWEAPEEMRE